VYLVGITCNRILS